MTDAFTIKQLQASITINPDSTTPTFNGTSDNTVTFGGSGQNAIRMMAAIHNAEGIDNRLDLTVYGLDISVMNQLSTYGQQINLLPKNKIVLSAGDDNGMSQVYDGAIIGSTIDINQPEASMRITANGAAAFSAVPGTPQSYSGQVDVATVMGQIANAMGLQFENNGVSSKLSDVYLYGSPRDQYTTLVAQADIGAAIDRGVLSIWPKFKSRGGDTIALSPFDGSMIGYPVYTSTGIMARALFNPSFGIGKQFSISGSQLKAANGTWNTYGVDHFLESQMPGGKWESILLGSSNKFPTPVI